MGCLCGLIASPFYIIYEVYRAFVVLLDRFFTGIANGCCHKDELRVIDSHREARVHETGKTIPPDVDGILAHGIPDQRKKEIFRAGEMALCCKSMFLRSSPYYPDKIWHYKVVSADKMLATFTRDGRSLKLDRRESEALSKLLTERADSPISFSMFLLLVRHAIDLRPSPRTIGTSNRDRLHLLFNSNEGIRQWTEEMFGNQKKNIGGSVARFEMEGLEDIAEEGEEATGGEEDAVVDEKK